MPSSAVARWLQGPGGTVRVVAPLIGLAALLAALIWAGQEARNRLRPLERYSLAFGEIACPTPPGSTLAEFLTEVQYLGGFPDRLPLLDRDLPERLSAAFGRHPWVEKVERVEVGEKAVQVRLTLRKPALVVEQFNRVVDRRGILLPATAPTAGLPVLTRTVKPPAGPAGTAWGDERVTAAVREYSGRRQ
jgi:hypothetical protein